MIDVSPNFLDTTRGAYHATTVMRHPQTADAATGLLTEHPTLESASAAIANIVAPQR